jgi:hypothetical protein
MAWRTRRIVAELNALKSVESLADFEAELRGVLLAQETRCRTKLTTASLSDECALREREALEREEAMKRRELTQTYYSVASRQFDMVHLAMLEETTRRALRCSERSARCSVAFHSRTALLFLVEDNDRGTLCAQEECCREEMKFRRLVEVGNDLQREIITTNRLSNHLRSVARSRTVQEARHQLELLEDRDRSAVERLYQLHTVILFESARSDFSAAIQKDVLLLSEVGRRTAQKADEAACASCVASCAEQESRLRLLVEEQEAEQFKTLAQGFLLGWRSMYKAITKDPDIISAFRKMELLVRRDIASQERRAFGALQLASDCSLALLKRQRADRLVLCQEYLSGARALWADESRAANQLFRLHHLQQRELNALQLVTVLTTAEAAARRGVSGAEAQARLSFKMRYATASVLLSCSEGLQRLQSEEARDFSHLHRRYVDTFHTQQVHRLALEERGARMMIEHDESTAAADLFLSVRQALAHLRSSDVTRPVVVVEESFRAQLADKEQRERQMLSVRHCRLVEHAARQAVEVDEQAARWRLALAQLCEAEKEARQALCSAASGQLASLHALIVAAVTEQDTKDGTGSDSGADGRKALDTADAGAKASLHLHAGFKLPDSVEQAWSELCADWELAESASSTASFESRRTSVPSLLNSCTAECEEVVTDAYLERDLIHFMEHAEWRRILQQLQITPVMAPPVWRLHSISLKQEPNRRAATVNMWDSKQLFDVSFSLAQQQQEGIVGERTIAFHVPDALSAAAVLPRRATASMVFFLVLDQEGSVLASASLAMDAGGEDCGHLCVALDNAAGYLRFQ